MNTFAAGSTPHLDDAELMQLLDGEETEERARCDEHLAACVRCTSELDRLRADAGVVRVWLERAAFEQAAPRHTVSHPRWFAARYDATWLRAAAAIALLAIPVAAITTIPPLRAWIFGTDDPASGDAAVSATQAAPEPLSSTLRFPVGAAFTVQIDAAQNAGTLTIAQGSDDVAVLDSDASSGAVPTVSASALRIRNSAASAASYRLQLPATVTNVIVRIGEQTTHVLDANAIRAGTVIPIRIRR